MAVTRPSTRRRSLLGNRVWLVETSEGPVIQKLYRERGGTLRVSARRLLVRLGRRKTGPGANARWRTERDTLAAWRAVGFDVPADCADRTPGLVADRVLLMEYLPGPTMIELLASDELGREERAALLSRFAAEWGRRHHLALDTRDARLVQEHGTFAHVIVSGRRLVTIDLEQSFRARCDPSRLIAKEILGYLSSLRKRVDAATFGADFETLVRSYPDRERLVAAIAAYARPSSLVRRALCGLERSLHPRRRHVRRKYEVIGFADAALRAGSDLPFEAAASNARPYGAHVA